jgi:hypothetical protein
VSLLSPCRRCVHYNPTTHIQVPTEFLNGLEEEMKESFKSLHSRVDVYKVEIDSATLEWQTNFGPLASDL